MSNNIELDGLDLEDNVNNQVQYPQHPQSQRAQPRPLTHKKEIVHAVKQFADDVRAKEKKKSEEEIKEHRALVRKLIRYGRSKLLKDILQGYNFDLSGKRLRKMEVPELQELLEEIKEVVDGDDQSDFVVNAALSMISGAEPVVYALSQGKVNIIGLGDDLQANKQFLTSMEIWNLENSDVTQMSPIARVMSTVLFSALTRYSSNKSSNHYLPDPPTLTERESLQNENNADEDAANENHTEGVDEHKAA